MSSPPPPTTPPASQKFDWVNFGCGVLFFGGIVGAFVWGLMGAPRFWDFSDGKSGESVVVEGESEYQGGVSEYGRIYSQAQVDLPPGAELVLPVSRVERTTFMDPVIEVEVRADGEPGVVRILTEASVGWRPSPGKTRRLSEWGRGTGVAKRRLGSVVALDVETGHMHWELGGTRVRVIFIVPSGQKVRQESPTASEFRGSNTDPRFLRGALQDGEKAAGWEEVPLSPLPQKQFR